jgi:Tol biopolymer transport system component
MASVLEVHEVATGSVREVWRSGALFEAPNWSPDGQWLVINGAGLLYRLPVTGGTPQRIDTGFATACNNDHGFSPDGAWIGFSHRTEAGSSIFMVPSGGGEPRAVTPVNPSYWHGWSPDGMRLAYCGQRARRFDIFTCAVDGSDERRLTADAGHNDGPDYSPDGEWIWFNSDRGGHAQIWRMRVDGSDLGQMTDDTFVNWFPHPSPCGRHVLYLAYPPGTLEHPRDRDVGLRLMNPDGTGMREVARFNGGQGTINVPCWAPDGSAFAFMRYEA